MIRKAFLMKIYPGQEAEYAKRHEEIWPDLRDELKSHGVHNYSIFRDGLNLFAYAEIEDEARWNAIAQTAACKRWWAYMAPIMESNADKSPVSKDIPEVFHLD
ncbi:MAG: L-rhamnose mutarotase [bacterium]|nr:L-rhamnose mutarotase [bacterium]